MHQSKTKRLTQTKSLCKDILDLSEDAWQEILASVISSIDKGIQVNYLHCAYMFYFKWIKKTVHYGEGYLELICPFTGLGREGIIHLYYKRYEIKFIHIVKAHSSHSPLYIDRNKKYNPCILCLIYC